MKKPREKLYFSLALLSLLSALFFLPLAGKIPVSFSQYFNALRAWVLSKPDPSGILDILIEIRFPRVVASILAGMALAAAGTAYQAIFCNPMVSPDLLGASAGAAFGAALAIVMSLSITGLQLMSFLFGLLAVALAYFIASRADRGQKTALILILSGMVVSSIANAAMSLIKYTADTNTQLPEITFWLMGNIAPVNKSDIGFMLPPVLLGIIVVFLFRWQINVMSFGEEEAATLGVNTKLVRILVISAATLMTSATVSVCGQIGWLGLIVPHLSRMLVGADIRKTLPMSLLLGGTFLALTDTFSRTVPEAEIPIGILTAFAGAPFFIFLLLKGKKGWN
ncbi:MAG: iron ABC transporter permease [Candidatus Riflebacteria bacterium]|nr:iron ABC transporter permease [Candidatus Riflebacteria bacterium]